MDQCSSDVHNIIKIDLVMDKFSSRLFHNNALLMQELKTEQTFIIRATQPF